MFSSASKAVDWWLSPGIPAHFLDACRRGQWCHFRGSPDKYDAVYSLEEFKEFLQRSSFGKVSVRASFDERRDEEYKSAEFQVVPGSRGQTFFLAGATICATGLSAETPKLKQLAEALRSGLGFLGSVKANAYWSPDRAGFGCHFDARIACTMQIHGEKTWRISKRPAVAWPPANAAVTAEGRPFYVQDGFPRYEDRMADWEKLTPPAAEDFDEVTLRPGDLLTVPAGSWHAASAHGESFAVNMAFDPRSTFDAVETYLASRLRHLLPHRNVPFLGLSGGAVDPAIRAQLAACLEEMSAELDALREDPMRLLELFSLERALPPPARAAAPAAREAVLVLTQPLTSTLLVDDASDAGWMVVRGSVVSCARQLATLLRPLFVDGSVSLGVLRSDFAAAGLDAAALDGVLELLDAERIAEVHPSSTSGAALSR